VVNAERSQTITKSKLLLVEGPDDHSFFDALLRHLNRQDIEVRSYNGKDNLRPFLKGLPAFPEFVNVMLLGITRDADDYADRTFQSICDSLSNANLPVPDAPLVLASGQPQVTVMIIPPGENKGMLEDLCLSVLQDDPAMPCVNQYFDCVENQMGNLPRNMAKAKVHAFLASRERPDLRLGEAALRGYLPWDSSAFEPVRQFISHL